MSETRNYIKGEIVSVAIYDVEEYPMHHHKDPEIIFIIDGQASVHTSFYSIDAIEENHFIFINADTIHNIEKIGGPCRVMSIHFHMDHIAHLYNVPAFSAFSMASFDQYSSTQTIEQLRRYLINIACCYMEKTSSYKSELSDIVLECYTYMMNNFQWFYYDDYILHNYPQRLPLTQITRAEEILTYLQEHYSEKLTLSNVADAFYLNKYYLSHLLKDTLGMSFQDLLNAIRLNIALYPLLESGKSVEEIAEECRFSSAVYLRKAFAVHAKVSLSTYRKRYGKRNPEDSIPDIICYGKEEQLSYLKMYQRKYYPEDFLVENTERLSVYVILGNTYESSDNIFRARQLQVTPQTLFHMDYMRDIFCEMDFDRVFAKTSDFDRLYEFYGSYEFFSPVRDLCREFGIDMEIIGEEDEEIEKINETASVFGRETSMYGEKGFRTKWYYFHFLINRLYNERVFDKEFCTVSRQGKKISILCNNIGEDKYRQDLSRKEIFLHIEDIQCNYSIFTYTLQFHGDDEVAVWRSIGAPNSVSRPLRETIRSCCFPKVSHSRSTAQYDLLKGITLEPGEMKLLMLVPEEESPEKVNSVTIKDKM